MNCGFLCFPKQRWSLILETNTQPFTSLFPQLLGGISPRSWFISKTLLGVCGVMCSSDLDLEPRHLIFPSCLFPTAMRALAFACPYVCLSSHNSALSFSDSALSLILRTHALCCMKIERVCARASVCPIPSRNAYSLRPLMALFRLACVLLRARRAVFERPVRRPVWRHFPWHKGWALVDMWGAVNLTVARRPFRFPCCFFVFFFTFSYDNTCPPSDFGDWRWARSRNCCKPFAPRISPEFSSWFRRTASQVSCGWIVVVDFVTSLTLSV